MEFERLEEAVINKGENSQLLQKSEKNTNIFAIKTLILTMATFTNYPLSGGGAYAEKLKLFVFPS